MIRFNVDSMYNRLKRVGYIYKIDVSWLTKRKSELINYGRGRMPLTMEVELDTILVLRIQTLTLTIAEYVCQGGALFITTTR